MSGDNPNSFLCPDANRLPARIQKQDTKNRIQKKMRAHTEYCPHLIWLLLLKNKFLLSGIVNEYRYQQRYNTLRNHIMQLNMFVRIQKFG